MRPDSKFRRAWQWGDVRKRHPGMWAYALNRLTGLGLVLYLYIHLVVLRMLADGPSAWDSFIALARSPAFLMLDVILLAGLLIHSLNGVRVMLNGMGIGVGFQKPMFWIAMIIAIVATVGGGLAIFLK